MEMMRTMRMMLAGVRGKKGETRRNVSAIFPSYRRRGVASHSRFYVIASTFCVSISWPL
jgi:hypothetical protein